MEVYCVRSGINFKAEGFTNKMHVEGIHPIFYTPMKSLLSRAADWSSDRLTETEAKLLFLALLNSSEHVEWDATARPNSGTINLNMERLMKIVMWQNNIQTPQLKFPSFVISNETCTLTNVSSWIKSWEDVRSDWEKRGTSVSMKMRLEKKEQALERLIKSSFKDPEEYAGKLAVWAMIASSAPLALREYWISLFKLKGIEIYKASGTDLDELLEHLEDNLIDQVGTIYHHHTMLHIRKVIAKNQAGLEYALGFTDEEMGRIDLEALKAKPFRMLDDEDEVNEETIEQKNRNIIIAQAPTKEPQKFEFTTHFEYLKALARWNVAKNEMDKQVMQEKALLEYQQKLAREQVHTEETELEDLEEQIKALDVSDAVNELKDTE